MGSAHRGALLIEAHIPQNRGGARDGSVESDWARIVVAKGESGGGGMRESEPKSTVIWLMLASNSARPER